MIFGSIEHGSEKYIYYDGELETGMQIEIQAYGEVSGNLVINDVYTREKMTINLSKIETLTGQAFGNLDVILISTIKRSKSIFLIRNGDYTNLLNCVERGSDWFQLYSGKNAFTYSVDSGSENLRFTIRVRTAYEGV